MANAARRETRRQARLERRAQEEAKQRRSKQARRLWIAGGVTALVALVAIVIWSSTRPGSPASSGAGAAAGPGPAASGPAASGPAPQAARIVAVADQGRTHVATGQPHPAYNSNPPTSGWHYPSTAAWGFHNTELPDELLVHNLEHGGIWVTYKNEQDSAVVDPLVALAREFPRKLVITHRPKNDSPIAVAAWGQLMKLDRYDREVIVSFYNRFKNKGPEFVPD